MEIIKPSLQVDWISPVGRGMELEISAVFGGLCHQLLGIVADESDESLWVELRVDGKLVRIPVALLQELFSEAVGQIHSEQWLDARDFPPPGT